MLELTDVYSVYIVFGYDKKYINDNLLYFYISKDPINKKLDRSIKRILSLEEFIYYHKLEININGYTDEYSFLEREEIFFNMKEEIVNSFIHQKNILFEYRLINTNYECNFYFENRIVISTRNIQDKNKNYHSYVDIQSDIQFNREIEKKLNFMNDDLMFSDMDTPQLVFEIDKTIEYSNQIFRNYDKLVAIPIILISKK